MSKEEEEMLKKEIIAKEEKIKECQAKIEALERRIDNLKDDIKRLRKNLES